MPEYERKGILFPNNYKTKDNHPDFTGKATIEGVEYKVAAWNNYRENKPPFMLLRFDDPQHYEADDKPSEDKKLPTNDEIDENLPF